MPLVALAMPGAAIEQTSTTAARIAAEVVSRYASASAASTSGLGPNRAAR
jgi:hypothetical protein